MHFLLVSLLSDGLAAGRAAHEDRNRQHEAGCHAVIDGHMPHHVHPHG
jgi:hypothetical protein